jgi:hypothetical protein
MSLPNDPLGFISIALLYEPETPIMDLRYLEKNTRSKLGSLL